MSTGATTLWALDGATATVERGMLVTGATGTVTFPMPAFLIEHPRGLVLFDSGIASDAADDPRAVFGEFADAADLSFSREQRVDSQIRALGYRTEDVTDVLVSHSHFDHTGGLHLFPHADFHIGRGDLGYARDPRPEAAIFFRAADLESTRDYAWSEVTGDLDLFGDGTIVLLQMPGHTPGNSSLLVRLPNRNMLLTGDTVHLRSALTEELPMPTDHDLDTAVRSVRRLKQLGDELDATTWITHDPEDWAEFGSGTRCYD